MTRNVQGNYRIMVRKQKDTCMYLLKMTLCLLVLYWWITIIMVVIPFNALQIHDAIKSLVMPKFIFLLTDIQMIKVLCFIDSACFSLYNHFLCS